MVKAFKIWCSEFFSFPPFRFYSFFVLCYGKTSNKILICNIPVRRRHSDILLKLHRFYEQQYFLETVKWTTPRSKWILLTVSWTYSSIYNFIFGLQENHICLLKLINKFTKQLCETSQKTNLIKYIENNILYMKNSTKAVFQNVWSK